MTERKYIFITGGVLSGLGKGTMSASLGRLIKARGYRVTNLKFDPYINVDPGTMSLSRHGEVFVTDDGGECDLDIGHYERFIDENLTADANGTMGKVYSSVIERERARGYEGEDIQVIPHITDEIKRRIITAAEVQNAEITIVEIGGTVGDIESLPLLEALRQMLFDQSRQNVLFIHLTLVPYMEKSGEMKSKPTQHSVKELLSHGIQPDIIVCRSLNKINDQVKEKISLFCNVQKNCVIQNHYVDCIYDMPLALEEEGLANLVCEKLKINNPTPSLAEWQAFSLLRRKAHTPVNIALIGKYTDTRDAYLSVTEALLHAATHLNLKLSIDWIDAETPDNYETTQGIIIPGGFGERGVPGMIQAARHARENKIPFLGIALGMHAAAIEYARNILNIPDAYSSEYNPDAPPVIHITPQESMHRGAAAITLTKNSIIHKAYNTDTISERHRHRYQINPDFLSRFEEAGLLATASNINAIELPQDIHPHYLGVQFHPEFKSRPNRPHPLFLSFINAAQKEVK